MSNYPPCLREFIAPIPICQSEADLNNMLDIFQHLNCQTVAISDGRGGWGVVHARDLLSLVTKAWLGERVALIGHPRNAMSYQNFDSKTIPDLKVLIESVKLYQADLKLTEFLPQLDREGAFWEKTCLIVDREGALQGQLDRNKIIAYLATRSLSQKSLEVPLALTYLAGFIDEIALPSKIETARGETIHANQSWQLLGEKKDRVLSQTLKTTESDSDLDRMTKRWIENQKSIFSSNQSKHLNVNNNSQDFELASKPQSETKIDDGKDLPLEFEIEGESNWNYLKIPLVGFQEATQRQESYCLILATPAIETESVSNNSVPTVDKPTAQILKAVSHELKSPLTGIVGLSSLLKGQRSGSLNQRQIRYVELIHRSGRKMMQIIYDLLQLTTVTAESSSEVELINLEFLCRRLYQEILAKVRQINTDNNLVNISTQPQLQIKFGSEIAIANKLLLSSVLSHLMLEALAGLSNCEQLEIQVSSGSGGTTLIAISSSQNSSLNNDVGLDLTFAEHLAMAMGATVTDRTIANRRQLTLLLPKKEIQSVHPVTVPDRPSTARTTTANKVNKLTILCLYPELETLDPLADLSYESSFDLKNFDGSCGLPAGYQHRVIEADSIEQAHNLARIWQIDAIILNGSQIARPTLYLRSLQEYEHLASLPLITLDTKTTEAANQIEGLNVFPCLLPSQCRSIKDLIQVIQIAIES